MKDGVIKKSVLEVIKEAGKNGLGFTRGELVKSLPNLKRNQISYVVYECKLGGVLKEEHGYLYIVDELKLHNGFTSDRWKKSNEKRKGQRREKRASCNPSTQEVHAAMTKFKEALDSTETLINTLFETIEQQDKIIEELKIDLSCAHRDMNHYCDMLHKAQDRIGKIRVKVAMEGEEG